MTRSIPLPEPPDDATSDRRLAAFHIAFLLFGAAALVAAREGQEGWAVFAAGVAYNLALPISAVRWVHPRWVHLWGFLLPLSILQIYPDWVLVDHFGTLVFPDLGGILRVGDAVPVYMGFLWVAALLPVVYLGDRLIDTRGRAVALTAVAIATLAVFALAETLLTTWVPIWHAVDVATLGPVALYVLPAEVVLGVTTFLLWRTLGRKTLPVRILAALATMLTYLGALWCFHGLIEGF
ncbi:MAG: hypothetical protein AAGE94_15445 [Acidobacteriota bacterium]